MEMYIAIPRAITDVYWNGLLKESESLDIFFVKPEIKKGFGGNSKVIGFKEAITDEKITNRVYYASEYRIEHKDVDCMIENNAQIGDLSWEIIDKSTVDKLLSYEEIQKYMSLSPEEVREKLQNVRKKARSIGQKSRNLDIEDSLRNPNLKPNEIYIAIPKVITGIYRDGTFNKSKSLDIFFVKPEIKKGFLGISKVVGFKEAITGEKIAKRIYKGPEYIFWYEDLDCMIEKNAQIGDISWEIVDKSTADRLLSYEDIQKYMSLSPEEVLEHLKNVRIKAQNITQSLENSAEKKR